MITAAPATMTIGSTGAQTVTFQTLTGVAAAKVVLMRAGACTHGFDSSQRYVELVTSNPTSTSIQCVPPLNVNVAPKGWYMLFLLTNANVPSEAVWVQLV